MATERRKGTGPKLFSKTVTKSELQRNFFLPMEEAGKKWGVSTTIIKRVCRKFGIERWPYRQIQSAQKKIAALEEMLRTRTRTCAEQEKVKREIRALQSTIDDLLVNPNVPERVPIESSGICLATASKMDPVSAPSQGLTSVSSGGSRSPGGESHSGSAGGSDMSVDSFVNNGWGHRSTDLTHHGVGVVSNDSIRASALREDSQAAATMMRPPSAATVAAVHPGRKFAQDPDRSLTILPSSMVVPTPAPAARTGVLLGEPLRFSKRVKTEGWVPPAGTHRVIPGTATNSIHGIDRLEVGVGLGLGSYKSASQVKASRSASPPNGLMQVTVPPPPARASGVARRASTSINTLALGAFEANTRVADACWSTASNVTHTHGNTHARTHAHGRDGLRYDWSVHGLGGDNNTAWPSAGRNRAGRSPTETVCSSGMVTNVPVPLNREAVPFPIPGSIPFPHAAPSNAKEKELAGRVGGSSQDQTEMYLDDCGLLALVLKIPQACDSGEGTSSSSWGALSGGSYLNTDEAFAAFAATANDE